MIVRPEHFKFRVETQLEQERIFGELGMPPELMEALVPAETSEPHFVTAPEYCFFCGEKLTIPAVMWHGRHSADKNAPAEVWLHISCAERLVTGLRRDVDELRVVAQSADEEQGANY